MKKLFFILSFLAALLGNTYAQKSTKGKPEISVWHISEKTAEVLPAMMDTCVFDFQQSNQIDRYSIAKSYNGTLGSPLQSMIYNDRKQKTDFLFGAPYSVYVIAPTEILFYNTKTPYSNLTYHSSGGKLDKEDDFSALFTMNANKRTNFGGLLDYVEAQGVYEHQATKMLKGGIWASYLGKWYQATGIYMYHSFNNQENGGIADPAYITRTDSLSGYKPENIPVKLYTPTSRYINSYFYLNQKISLGNGKNATNAITKDSIKIATLSHTLYYEQSQKRYRDAADSLNYYTQVNFDSIMTLDSARYRTVRNIAALTLNEGFSKWFPLGLRAYIQDDYQEYFHLNDSTPVNAYENDVLIGAEIAKLKGKSFLFHANAELYTLGRRTGDFNLDGGISSTFRLFKDTVSFKSRAFMKNTSPSYFENNYISNHFIWSNDFDKTLKTHIEASLGIKNKHLDFLLAASVENINQLVYFDANAMPMQYTGAIQLLSGDVKLNLKLGPLYLHNKLIYQQASNEVLLPLPEISTYNNLFFGFKMFKKVLTAQIGTDMYYHSAYYAPAYMPATGIFYLQHNQLIGNYPLISAYANFHLKTASFYFKYSHISALFAEPNYFSMPDYPLNPDMFRMGITWNFFD